MAIISTLLHPRRTPPPPIDVDLAHVMSVGIAVWGATLVVTGTLWWVDVVPARWVGVAGAGVLLGVAGYVWARRNGRLASDGSGAMVRPHEDDLKVRH